MGKTPIKMKAVVYALSPFQQKIMPGLWKDLPGKIHHKVSENWISATLLLAPLAAFIPMAAQLVWTPIDVISQRLMIQTSGNNPIIPTANYSGEIDAFQKIMRQDGVRGLYRGFGVSILTSAPSNAVWWASNSTAHKLIWGSVCAGDHEISNLKYVAVEGASAAIASGVWALITMPLDIILNEL
ncbi:unnamed protein product [Rhodiola kirilowii]